MRGKVYKDGKKVAAGGITPAYAGKSQHGERDSGKSEDHPRLCGEKCSNENRRKIILGSPPPMRGKVDK